MELRGLHLLNNIEIIKSGPSTFQEEAFLSNKLAMNYGLDRISYSLPILQKLCDSSMDVTSLYANIDFPHTKLGIDFIEKIISDTDNNKDILLCGYNIGIDLNMIAQENISYLKRFNDMPTNKPFRIACDISRFQAIEDIIDLVDEIPRLSGIIIWDSFNNHEISDTVMFTELIAKNTDLETTLFSQVPIQEIFNIKFNKKIRVATTLNNIMSFLRKGI